MVTLKIYFQRPASLQEIIDAVNVWNEQADAFKLSYVQCADAREWIFIIRPVKMSIFVTVSVLEAFSAFAMCHLPEWSGEIYLMQ